MDYYGLLFLYYLKGLSGKSVLRLFFNIEAGGTEQLLPENTSTPTTTPILADIQYPDGLRTDQYFTYRKTPTTISNKARIKTIKGNTLVWNQLFNKDNFRATTTSNGITFTNNGDGSITMNGTATATATFIFQNNAFTAIQGHKYTCGFQTPRGEWYLGIDGVSFSLNVSELGIATLSQSGGNASYSYLRVPSGVTVSNVKVYPQIFDLTQMGLDSITDPSDFTSLFPLPYYSYNQGTLLSFNGNGIKTVGFNQWDEQTRNGYYNNSGGFVSQANTIANSNFIKVFPNTEYYCKSGTYHVSVWFYDANGNFVTNQGGYLVDNGTFTTPSNCWLINFCTPFNSGSTFNHDICINISSSRNGEYEPYTSSTLSLPISAYFPTGMKSAGSVYDELTESKAITRIGAVNLGSLTWAYAGTNSSEMRMYTDGINSLVKPSASTNVKGNLICALYPSDTSDATYLKQTCIAVNQTGRIFVYDPNYNTTSSPSAFKTAMDGVMLYYELATPTETPITTEDANEALSLLMGKSVSSNNANQLIDIITKGE